MKKIMKKIVVCVAVLTISSAFALTAMAGDPGLSGKNYVIGTKIINNPEISFMHVAVNQSSSQDQVTFSVSRTKKFTGSLSGEIEGNAVVYKCGIKSEVSYGTESSYSTSCTWTVPAYSSVTCRYGSALVNTTGTMETWFNGRLTSARTTSAKYTYASYSDKYVN